MTLLKLYKDLQTGSFILMDKDDPILCPFQFIQSVPDTIWHVIHNRDSLNIAIQIYVNNKLVTPHDIINITPDSFDILFSIPVNGVANVAVYTDPTHCIPLLSPTVTPTLTPTPTLTMTMTPTVTPTT